MDAKTFATLIASKTTSPLLDALRRLKLVESSMVTGLDGLLPSWDGAKR